MFLVEMALKVYILLDVFLCSIYDRRLVDSMFTTKEISYLKGHSQLVHMRIRYHSIANLHITETQ